MTALDRRELLGVADIGAEHGARPHAISLLDRPVLILPNQPTVGGRKRVINGPGGRGGAKGAEKG